MKCVVVIRTPTAVVREIVDKPTTCDALLKVLDDLEVYMGSAPLTAITASVRLAIKGDTIDE